MPDRPPITVGLGEGVELRLLPIPAGRFRMGQRGGEHDEEPVTEVTVEAFWMGETPVTQAQYRLLAMGCAEELAAIEGNLGAEPSEHKGRLDSDRRPVENVNWHEARIVARRLQGILRAAGQLPEGHAVDLPTEAQWEYACRGGSDTEYWSGDGQASLKSVGWYEMNARGETHPVASPPQAGASEHPWKLLDLHGNVQEWCLDLYDSGRPRLLLPGTNAVSAIEDRPSAPDPDAWFFDASAQMFGRFGRDDRTLHRSDFVLLEHWHRLLSPSAGAEGLTDREASAALVLEALRRGEWPAEHLELAMFVRGVCEQRQDPSAAVRVVRGGSWGDTARWCRSAFRGRGYPSDRDRNLGFRVALLPRSGASQEETEAASGGARG